MAASDKARVYAAGTAVYGCALSARRPLHLGDSRSCLRADRVTVVAVAGALAAYGTQRCGVDTGLASLVVRRLTDGARLRQAQAISAPVGPESYTTVTSVVVKADTSVAWVGVGSSIVSHRRVIEVRAEDSHGSHVLDQSTLIDPSSLRLNGSRLSWRDRGVARSATLR